MSVLFNQGRGQHEVEEPSGGPDHRDREGARGGEEGPGPCAENGVSEHTIYRWRAKYGGMSVSDAARLKALEDENRRLKHLLAEQVLDNHALKVALRKNY